MLKLYDAAVSGNAYKVRLLAALAGIELVLIPVDLAAGESRTEAFLAINPRGQIPGLVDGEIVVWDSQAILVHLARTRAGDWLPEDTAALVGVMQWLAVAENEILYGLARARAVRLFGRPWDLAQSQELGRAGLQVMDRHLGRCRWLATERPCIADIACYPYVALAPEGEVSLADYANVRRWIGDVQALPGYIGMPGIKPAAEMA